MTDYSTNLEKAIMIIDRCLSRKSHSMTTKELAEILDTTPRTIRRICDRMSNFSYELDNFEINVFMSRKKTVDSRVMVRLK